MTSFVVNPAYHNYKQCLDKSWPLVDEYVQLGLLPADQALKVKTDLIKFNQELDQEMLEYQRTHLFQGRPVEPSELPALIKAQEARYKQLHNIPALLPGFFDCPFAPGRTIPVGPAPPIKPPLNRSRWLRIVVFTIGILLVVASVVLLWKDYTSPQSNKNLQVAGWTLFAIGALSMMGVAFASV